MKGNAVDDKMILIYQGNMLAIVKEMQKEMLGTEKVMIFILGYRQSVSSIFCYWRLMTCGQGKPRTSLSGLRTLVPSALNPSPSTAAFHVALLLYMSAIS